MAGKGKVMLPVNEREVWGLDTDELGLLVLVHRAVLLAGDRESGLVPASEVHRLALDHGGEPALESLLERGLLRSAGDAVHVASWSRCQGSSDAKRRARNRRAAKAHRQRLRSAKYQGTPQETRGGRQRLRTGDSDDRQRLRTANTPGTQGETPGTRQRLRDSDGVVVVVESNSARSTSGGSSTVASEADVGVPVAARFPGQAALFSGELDPDTEAVLGSWSCTEPLRRLSEPAPLVAQLRRAYPDVDLVQAAREMEVWWTVNPDKHAARLRRLPQFVLGWVASSQGKINDQRAAHNGRDPVSEQADELWGKR